MDYIIQHWPAIIVWLGSVATAFLGGIWVNRLTMNREADTRRRKFRDDIRGIALRFDSVNWMKFVETYDATVPVVRDACVKVSEDIFCWKRGRFAKHRDTYCGFKHSDLELPRPSTPAGLEEYMRANKKKREDMTAELKSLLERLADDAA